MVQVISNGASQNGNRSASTNQPRAPVWKTVLKVTLIIVAVAAAIYLGAKFVYPAIVKMVGAAGGAVTATATAAATAAEAVAATAEVGTSAATAVKNTAQGLTKVIRAVDKLGNFPLVVTGVDVINTTLTKMGDSLTVVTDSGRMTNPGAVLQFIKNPFSGFLNMLKGVFK